MKKFHIGYTQGVFDMFHIGHLNLLKQAKRFCDFLIVGVNSDELVKSYKKKETIVPDKDRAEIVRSIKYVDQCDIVYSLDKFEQWKKYGFEAVFIGDDWKGNKRWIETEKELEKANVKIIYLNYTLGISSTFLREKGKNAIEEE